METDAHARFSPEKIANIRGMEGVILNRFTLEAPRSPLSSRSDESWAYGRPSG
jgi:hypothetical protein